MDKLIDSLNYLAGTFDEKLLEKIHSEGFTEAHSFAVGSVQDVFKPQIKSLQMHMATYKASVKDLKKLKKQDLSLKKA